MLFSARLHVRFGVVFGRSKVFRMNVLCVVCVFVYTQVGVVQEMLYLCVAERKQVEHGDNDGTKLQGTLG